MGHRQQCNPVYKSASYKVIVVCGELVLRMALTNKVTEMYIGKYFTE